MYLLYLVLLFTFCTGVDLQAAEDETGTVAAVPLNMEEYVTETNGTVSLYTDEYRTCAVKKESSSLTYLVDTTGSMYDDFIELKCVNSWLMDRITARFPCGVRQYTMVEYNDPTIGPVRFTEYKAAFEDFFNNLIADGGGDCPELVMAGLKLALENSPPKSFILVLTDASALDSWDKDLIKNIYSLIETTQSQIFFLVTGLYGSIDDADVLVYRNIAAASFGHVFHVALSQLNKVFNYLDFTLPRPANSSEHLFSAEYNAGSNSDNFSIEDYFTELLITMDGVIYSIQVLGPDSFPLEMKTIVSEDWGSTYLVNNPEAGTWTIITNAASHYSVRVEGFTAVHISSTAQCSDCHPNAKCEDSLGFSKCSCKDGFIGDGFTCSDIDECAYLWTNNCSLGICENTFGSYTCVCPSGYISSSGNACIDIDECSSADLNNCYSSATCINNDGSYSCVCPYGYFGDGYDCEVDECTQGACGLGMECLKTHGSYQCSDPCSDHKVINEPWRSTSNIYGYRGNCDSDKFGWYRFIGSGGVRMPETCVPQKRCDTSAPMWLSGSHPILSDGIVKRTACANWGENCCYFTSTVQLKACPGGYHIYKLSGTPTCTLSYCTDPDTVSNKCEADEEWKLKDGEYGCYCKDQYEVSAIEDVRPELNCGINEMKVSFQKCQLKSLNLNISSIRIKDGNCFGYQDDPITDTFSILSPLQAGACGLQITENGTHAIYENSLHITVQSTGKIKGNHEINVDMYCVYSLDMLISLNTFVKPIFSYINISIGGDGQLQASMSLYKDSSYLTPYEGSVVLLSSASILYVGVFVQGGDDSQYTLVMKNCYATPSGNPDDPIKYYTIKDSCANSQDSTISVLENGVSRKGRFSVELFSFVGGYNYVYMHCAISLCDNTTELCAPSCSGIGSRSASTDEIYQMILGPIVRKDSTSSSSESVGKRPSCALLGLVLFLLIKAAFV